MKTKQIIGSIIATGLFIAMSGTAHADQIKHYSSYDKHDNYTERKVVKNKYHDENDREIKKVVSDRVDKQLEKHHDRLEKMKDRHDKLLKRHMDSLENKKKLVDSKKFDKKDGHKVKAHDDIDDKHRDDKKDVKDRKDRDENKEMKKAHDKVKHVIRKKDKHVEKKHDQEKLVKAKHDFKKHSNNHVVKHDDRKHDDKHRDDKKHVKTKHNDHHKKDMVVKDKHHDDKRFNQKRDHKKNVKHVKQVKHASSKKHVVAYYDGPHDPHTVILPDGSEKTFVGGVDVVKKAGKSKVFKQWYIPKSKDSKGYHTVWRPMKSSSCGHNWMSVHNPHNPPSGDTWGNYFPDGVDYCVKTNAFMVG